MLWCYRSVFLSLFAVLFGCLASSTYAKVWRALCRQFLRLPRPPLRSRLSSFRHPCKRLVLLLALPFRQNIQAIQSPIPAIVQQSLSVVVSAHSVSQDLPAIAAHLAACGFHQPWSPSVPIGVLPSTSSSSTPPVPVATPTNVLTGMSSSLIVPSFVPAFSSASLSSIAPCSSVVYSHPTTINSALASHPIVTPTAFTSLAALPLQQPFVVGPGYSPVPFKVVSQITAGKVVNLEDLLAENITMPEQEPQLWFNAQLVLSHTPKKNGSVRLRTSCRGRKPFPYFISFSVRLSRIDGEI